MALPREHREEIETLAGEWTGLNVRARRVERLNQLSTVLVVVCGGALLAFPTFLSSSEWLVVPPTGAFLWGGWYKMYMVGRKRRAFRTEAGEIEQRLKDLCGPDVEFAGDGVEIALDGKSQDPFKDASYG